jgi:LCP family protein required for cell wall assembly
LKYVLLIDCILVASFLLTLLLQLASPKKRFIGLSLSAMLIIGLICGTLALSKTNTILSEITQPEEYYDQIVIVVKTNSPIDSHKDLNDKCIGVQYSLQPDLMLAAEGELIYGQQITFNTQQYESLTDQVSALFSDRVDAILYNSAYAGLISEQWEDFGAQVKIIYTRNFTKSDINKYKNTLNEDITDDPIDEPIDETIAPNTQPQQSDTFSVYISGIDVYGSIAKNSRSDVNIIAIVNTAQKKILLITTPRDYYVPIAGVSGNKKDKLTHAGIYGIDASMNTLSELYDVPIDYYIRINFTSFEQIVDALGGISVYSDYSFNSGGYKYKSGYNDLNGKQALRFCRERHSFAEGDRQRGKNQQAVIKGIIEKACSPAILLAANSILDSVRTNIDMNIPEELIQSLIRDQLDDGGEWDIQTISADGSDSKNTTFSMPNLKSYVMLPDYDSVQTIKDAIQTMYESMANE